MAGSGTYVIFKATFHVTVNAVVKMTWSARNVPLDNVLFQNTQVPLSLTCHSHALQLVCIVGHS